MLKKSNRNSIKHIKNSWVTFIITTSNMWVLSAVFKRGVEGERLKSLGGEFQREGAPWRPCPPSGPRLWWGEERALENQAAGGSTSVQWNGRGLSNGGLVFPVKGSEGVEGLRGCGLWVLDVLFFTLLSSLSSLNLSSLFLNMDVLANWTPCVPFLSSLNLSVPLAFHSTPLSPSLLYHLS